MVIRILCDAIPFCFGPAAALETLLRRLMACGLSIEADVLATGSTLEFLQQSDLPLSLLKVDSEDPDALSELDLSPYRAFLTVCNPVSWSTVRRRGLPSAYVDFLLWMHSGPASEYFGADLYLAENYPGTAEWIRERGQEIPSLVTISPLVQPVVRKPRKGTLLVGFGGLYSRLTVPGLNTNYGEYVTNHLLQALPRGRFERVMIAGPRGLGHLLAPLVSRSPGVSFHSFSHRDFLQALGECEAFLSHPGLYAPFEAILGGVPTGFLPPSNYTQVLQLRHFRRCGMAEHSFSWDDLGTGEIPSDLPEPEGVAAVLREIEVAERSSATSAAFRRALIDFLTLDGQGLAGLGTRQQTVAAAFCTEDPLSASQQVERWYQRL